MNVASFENLKVFLKVEIFESWGEQIDLELQMTEFITVRNTYKWGLHSVNKRYGKEGRSTVMPYFRFPLILYR